jgi:hypothetical protein
MGGDPSDPRVYVGIDFFKFLLGVQMFHIPAPSLDGLQVAHGNTGKLHRE